MIARRELAAAFAVGLLLRVAVLAFVDYRIDDGDGAGYHRIAVNLALHGVASTDVAPPFHPTVERAPGLPLVASVLFRIAGDRFVAVQLFDALVTTLAALLLALAVARIAPAAARWALWLAVLSPFDIAFSGAMLAEPLCTALLVTAFAAPLLWPRAGWAVAGVALGGAALGRDIYLGLVPFVAALVVVAGWRAHRSRNLGRAALLLAGALVVVAPWTARNWQVSGRVIPVTRGLMWLNLWVGTWERSGAWQSEGMAVRVPPDSYRTEDERRDIAAAIALEDPIARDARFRELALRNLRERPLAVAGRWLVRWPRMWIGTRWDLFRFRPSSMARGRPLWIAFKLAMLGLDLVLLALAVAGLALAWRRQRALLWLAVPLAYELIVYLPFHNTETRYSQPVFPFVLVFAALALSSSVARRVLWERSYRTRSSP